MKLLVLFFIAAVWLQLPADGEASRIPSLRITPIVTKRSIFLSKRDSDEDSGEASSAVRETLDYIFQQPEWRELILTIAPDEAMDNPEFRAKWQVTAADEKERERVEENEEDMDSSTEEKIIEFFNSNKWKALLVLSSTKAELLDDNYRNMWELGELSDDVKHSKEGDNFFEGPQWKEFLELTGIEEYEDNDWMNAVLLSVWLMEVGADMENIDTSTEDLSD